MPYHSYRSFRRNRYYRKHRYNRTLSTKNIYSKRSSLAQANQISALRRSVNRINRKIKPEIKQTQTKINTHVWASYDYPSPGDSYIVNQYHTWAAVNPEIGPEYYKRIGDKIYRKDKYYFDLSLMSEMSNRLNEPKCIRVRFILYKMRTMTLPLQYQADDLPANFFFTQDDTDPQNISGLMTAPLRPGLSDWLYVLKDFVVSVTGERPTKQVKISSKWYTGKFTTDEVPNKSIEEDSNNLRDTLVTTSNRTYVFAIIEGTYYSANSQQKLKLQTLQKTVWKDI